jgi:hypothetical protein
VLACSWQLVVLVIDSQAAGGGRVDAVPIGVDAYRAADLKRPPFLLLLPP